MAIIGTQDTDDEENKAASDQPGSSPQTTGGAGAGAFVGGTGSGSGQGATTGTSAGGGSSSTPGGGGYTNLSQYLNVNQGSGATTGQAAGNVVQQSADAATGAQGAYSQDATSDINNATSAVGVNQNNLNAINAGQQNINQDTLNQIKSGAYSYNPTGDLNSQIQAGQQASSAQAYKGPTDFSSVKYSGPDIGSITAQYGGPQNTSDFQGQTAADQTAAVAANQTAVGNSANAAGGQTGVSALLRQAYQQPQYTQGENNLDAFLAGGTAGGQQALSNASGLGQNVTNAYSGIQNALSGGIQKGIDTANATNTTYKDAIDKATSNSTGTQDYYNTAVSAAKASGQSAISQAQAAAQQASATQAQQLAAQRAAQAASNPLQNDYNNLGQNIKSAPTTLQSQASQAVKGNITPIATTYATGGANIVAPATTKAGENAIKATSNNAAKAVKKVSFKAYGGLIKKLRG